MLLSFPYLPNSSHSALQFSFPFGPSILSIASRAFSPFFVPFLALPLPIWFPSLLFSSHSLKHVGASFSSLAFFIICFISPFLHSMFVAGCQLFLCLSPPSHFTRYSHPPMFVGAFLAAMIVSASSSSRMSFSPSFSFQSLTLFFHLPLVSLYLSSSSLLIISSYSFFAFPLSLKLYSCFIRSQSFHSPVPFSVMHLQALIPACASSLEKLIPSLPSILHSPFFVSSHNSGPILSLSSSVTDHLFISSGPSLSLPFFVSLPLTPNLFLVLSHPSISISFLSSSFKCIVSHSNGCSPQHPSRSHVAAIASSTAILAGSPSLPPNTLSIVSHMAAAAVAYTGSNPIPALHSSSYTAAFGAPVVKFLALSAAVIAASISLQSSSVIMLLLA